jgi:hypothetical protein
MFHETREYLMLGRRVRVSTDQLRIKVRSGDVWVCPEEVRPFGRCYACTLNGEAMLVPLCDVQTEINMAGVWMDAVAV